jgi:DNA-binding NarL/FixJ family response regulator
MTPTISVLLVENHAVVREGLRELLRSDPGIEVVGEAADGREAVQRTRELRPAVVVMDLAMPLLNGLEATAQIRKAFPATRVVILSAHGDDEYVDRAIEIGATGYLIKQSNAELLARAIREVHKGKIFFSPAIANRLRARRNEHPKSGGVRLTSREREVLQLIAEGRANKQTAAELGISIKTVEKHRQHLMSKLGIHDTAGLTRYALAEGIIEGGVRFTLEEPHS